MKPTFKDAETLERLFAEDKYEEAQDLINKFDWSTELTEENGKYGLKNCIGEQLVQNSFEDFKELTGTMLKKNQRVVAKSGGKWGIIVADGEGSWILLPEFDFISFPNNEFAVRKGDKWGIMDLSTQTYIIPLEQDLVYTPAGFLYNNGVAFFEKDGKTGMLNTYGEKTEAIFDDIDYDDGVIKVLYQGKWGYADEKGNFTEDPDENAFFDDF